MITEVAHAYRVVDSRDVHNRPMLRASCSCGWKGKVDWYSQMFVKQDYEQHVREMIVPGRGR